MLSIQDPEKPVRQEALEGGTESGERSSRVADRRSIAGAHVRFDSERSYILASDPRLYDLTKNTTFGSHLLTLTPQGGGITFYTFTYGNDCQQDVASL